MMDNDNEGMIVYKPRSKVSFEITALIQEWHDFLLAQCGYEEADHELIARLSAHHEQAFGTTILEEAGIMWNPVNGTFVVPASLWMRCGQKPPLTLEQLDLIWSDCFNDTSSDWFEAIENGLYDEREHRLVG